MSTSKIEKLKLGFLEVLLKPTPAWKAILSLIGFFSVCFITGFGKILIILFPACSFFVGVFLYSRAPALYIGFTFWMWFLSPLIRRLIDYQSGYFTPGPLTFTALLVTSISFLTFLKELPKTHHKSNLPFILCFGTLFYGLLIGLIQNQKGAALANFLGWLCPLSFGFHLFANWRRYPQYSKVVQQSFLWGVITVGAYGIIQFCFAPQWDRFWLINADMVSFGLPEPFGIRVMSTMGSPQAFASTMMAGLILLFSNQKNFLFLPATVVGYLTFLLSRARSAWLAWSVGLFIFVSFSKFTTQIKAIIAIALIILILLPLINIGPFSNVILSRLNTLSNTGTDSSLNARLSAYQNLFDLAITELFGKGFGFKIDLPDFGGRDSAILPTLFILGWLGVVPLVSGIGLLFLKMFYEETNKSDTFSIAARAICFAVLSQIGFNFIFLSAIGMIFWSFIGIYLASQKHYSFETKFLDQNK